MAELDERTKDSESKKTDVPDKNAGNQKSELKSKAKAAGVKSVFGIDERIVMTSFGKGNAAVMEKRIIGDNVESIKTPESYSAVPKKNKIDVTGTMEIRTKGSEKHKISALPDCPKKSVDGVLGSDLIGCKDSLEKRYFGKTFNDNLHIQVIYNILDIEKYSQSRSTTSYIQ